MNQIPSREVRSVRSLQMGMMVALFGITGCGRMQMPGQAGPAAATGPQAAAPAVATAAPAASGSLSQPVQASLSPTGPGTTAPAGSAQGSPQAVQAATVALSQQGDPYSYGASGPDSFDCSGLVQFAFTSVGAAVPRTSGELAQAGTEVSVDAIAVGDLVCWEGHVGIYVGGGQYVHAPQTGDVVRTADLASRPPNTVRRVL